MEETGIIICQKYNMSGIKKIIVRLKKQNNFFYLYFFFHCIKMRKELVFNNGYNNYTEDKYCFQKDKKPININEVDTKKIVLSNKTPYDEEGANKYYIGYVGSTSFRSLHIIIKNIKLYTDDMNVLANNNELLKYIEIRNKIETLLNNLYMMNT